MISDPAFVTGRLNVNDYVESRASDIGKLEQMIGNTGSNSKKRAFQSLPRAERRRAASHNPKRVPRKRGLRKRAELENIRDNAKKATKSRRSTVILNKVQDTKNVDVTSINKKVAIQDLHCLNLKYGQRQRDKIWLPTHIWHRKRASMVTTAGILIPESATQKQFRRTYRLQNHLDKSGAMAWDTSYISTFIARHPNLANTLDASFPGSTQSIYRERVKHWSNVSPGIGPALVYWLGPDSVVIQCHPLLFGDLWNLLTSSVSGVELEDCRFAVGSIDIAGSSALRMINHLCKSPASENTSSTSKKLIGTEFLPTRAVINACVTDPRLDKNVLSSNSAAEPHISVFVKEHRQKSLDSQASQSDIDRASLSKGDLGNPPAIPACVMSLNDGRLRLILPRGWVLPFWLEIFKRKHVLIGGQLELRQLSFESKRPFFPHDFAHTKVGSSFNHQMGMERSAAYHRKPKSKRSSLKGEIGNPFLLADLELLDVSEEHPLVHVEIRAIERGVPKAGARIFDVGSEHHDEQGRCKDSAIFCLENLLGFVTTGMFSLTEAKGTGIALIKNVPKKKLCVVKNIGCSEGFMAAFTLLEDARSVV